MKASGRADLGLEVNHFLIDNSNEMKFVGMDSQSCCIILFVTCICLNYVYIKSFRVCHYGSTDYLSRYHAVWIVYFQ